MKAIRIRKFGGPEMMALRSAKGHAVKRTGAGAGGCERGHDRREFPTEIARVPDAGIHAWAVGG